jgi:hypothetical protein
MMGFVLKMSQKIGSNEILHPCKFSEKEKKQKKIAPCLSPYLKIRLKYNS